MCHADSTDGVCIMHLVWSQDAVEIRFSHTKMIEMALRISSPNTAATKALKILHRVQ